MAPTINSPLSICPYLNGNNPAAFAVFVLYTVIDEPFETNGTSGSSLDALNLSRSIYEEALPYLNIYKDIKAEPVDTTNSAVDIVTHDIFYKQPSQ